MSPDKRLLDDLKIERDAPEQRTRSGRIWVAGVVAAVLGVAVFLSIPRPAEVRLFTVRGDLVSGQRTVLNASGYVTPRRQATVSAKVTGKVLEVLIEEGATVEEGEVLARLDASNVRANLRLAEAQFEAAQAGLRETEVRLDEARRELDRTSGLAEQRISSVADLDRARTELGSLTARLERQKLDSLVAQRQLALWEQQLEDTIIRAPFTGVVVSKDAQPGEMISPISAGGGFTRTGICTIVDMDSLEIEVDVNESYINRIQAGQPVEATLDAYPDWKIPARVIAIIPTADRQKATVRVRVAFDQLDPRILPEMGVKAAFLNPDATEAPNPGLPIPKTALQPNQVPPQVFIVQNGRVQIRPVELGQSQGQDAFVLSGLAHGEKIVLEPSKGLADGDRIRELKP